MKRSEFVPGVEFKLTANSRSCYRVDVVDPGLVGEFLTLSLVGAMQPQSYNIELSKGARYGSIITEGHDGFFIYTFFGSIEIKSHIYKFSELIKTSQ